MKKDIKAEILKTIEKINEKNPYYLVIGVLVLVLILDYSLIMRFQLGALRKLGPEVLQTKSDIERYERNKGRVGKYKTNIEELDKKLAVLQDRIINIEDIPTVLEGVSHYAKNNKVFVERTLPDMDLGDPVLENEQGKYYLLPVSITAVSGYHNLGKFLNDLEERGTLMNVSQLKISVNPENTRQHIVNLEIEAVIFESKIGAVK